MSGAQPFHDSEEVGPPLARIGKDTGLRPPDPRTLVFYDNPVFCPLRADYARCAFDFNRIGQCRPPAIVNGTRSDFAHLRHVGRHLWRVPDLLDVLNMSRPQARRPCENSERVPILRLLRQSSLRLHCGRYTIRITMRYEWNEDKSRSNRKKHGVAFEAAVKVFNDPFLLLIKDRIEEGEQRWHAIGAAEAAILLVVHAYRTESKHGEEDITRIISARPANKSERRRYFDQAAQ